MAKPTPTLSRKLEAATMMRASKALDNPFIVFLAGPYIDPDDEAKSNGSPASILRFQLFHRLQSSGFEVSLGEYQQLIDSYKDELGEHHNAAVAEIKHAEEIASLVVMIPASTGSFAEIGAFSNWPVICDKMIILADADHSTSTGYLNTGPVAQAKSLGSRVENVDYTKVEECFETVKAHSESVKTKFLLKSWLKT